MQVTQGNNSPVLLPVGQIATDDAIEYMELENGGPPLSSAIGAAANNIRQYQFGEVRYIATGIWVLIGAFAQP